jgi:hypothetical protein
MDVKYDQEIIILNLARKVERLTSQLEKINTRLYNLEQHYYSHGHGNLKPSTYTSENGVDVSRGTGPCNRSLE